jgi:hypothetical protein
MQHEEQDVIEDVRRPFFAQVEPNALLSSPEIERLSNFEIRLPIWIATAALLVAGLALVAQPALQQGTGIIITALLAGAGWAFTRIVEESRARQNIASGYISAIDRLQRELAGHLSDAELARYLALAPMLFS